MFEFINSLSELIANNGTLTLIIGLSSALLLIASILAMPWIVSQIPKDYFLKKHRERIKFSNPLIYLIVMIIKNALGLILLLLGIIMLFLPGPGILAILVGIIMLNFPGKYKLEQWFISRPGMLKAINWLRAKRGRKPLQVNDSL